VPYWDDRCGVKFTGAADLAPRFAEFWRAVKTDGFSPREMIMDNRLTLEGAAEAYADIVTRYHY
jgi:hypothetical protein